LPILLRALNLEFLGGLPDRIARVDKRADGFHKILRYHAALTYCASLNAARPDRLRLFQLFDSHVVSHVSLVQQITESHPLGRVHRFRFYAGPDYFPEIRISGKRVAFADHVLQRFATRVTNAVGEDLTQLLLVFFGSPIIGLTVGKSPAFVLPWSSSLLAFTYKETAEEYFLTTCLTVNEINSLEKCHPALGHTPHYGPDFVRPRVRTWETTRMMNLLYDRWHQRILLPGPSVPLPECIVKSLKTGTSAPNTSRTSPPLTAMAPVRSSFSMIKPRGLALWNCVPASPCPPLRKAKEADKEIGAPFGYQTNSRSGAWTLDGTFSPGFYAASRRGASLMPVKKTRHIFQHRREPVIG
jgi:hypothetical protein